MSNTATPAQPRQATIYLQGFGDVPAIPSQDVKPGMLLCWNGSWKESVVVSMEQTTPFFFHLVEADRQTGKEYLRRVKRDRLIAAFVPKTAAP